MDQRLNSEREYESFYATVTEDEDQGYESTLLVPSAHVSRNLRRLPRQLLRHPEWAAVAVEVALAPVARCIAPSKHSTLSAAWASTIRIALGSGGKFLSKQWTLRGLTVITLVMERIIGPFPPSMLDRVLLGWTRAYLFTVTIAVLV